MRFHDVQYNCLLQFHERTFCVTAFNEGERILIRSFGSPTCLQCHSISDFGRHLGVDTKCLDIMLPSVGGMVTSPCSAENINRAPLLESELTRNSELIR